MNVMRTMPLFELDELDEMIIYYGHQVLMDGENYHLSIKSIPKDLRKVMRCLKIAERKALTPGGKVSKRTIKTVLIKVADSFKSQLEYATGFKFIDMREQLTYAETEAYYELTTGLHMVEWMENTKFCAKCGYALELSTHEAAKVCMKCDSVYHPTVYTAMIVAIYKEDRILLARNRHSKKPFFSLVAGYIQPGESLEECVAREVYEETNLEITNIRYVMSQPWGFSSTIMVGFEADYVSGEIAFNDMELVEANWYRADELPQIPSMITVSRQIIERFINKYSH